MKPYHLLRRLIFPMLMIVLLSACRTSPTPSPIPPTATPGAPVPEATISVEGWLRYETEEFSISLPQSWSVFTPSDDNYQEMYEQFSATNPALAARLGGVDGLKGVELWAFDQEGPDPDFVDNLNIRLTPTEGQVIGPMDDLLAGIAEQYALLGWPVTQTTVGPNIAGQPAGAIAYGLPMIDRDNSPIQAVGRQYIVAARDALWIISFTSSPLSQNRQVAVIAQIANSFGLR